MHGTHPMRTLVRTVFLWLWANGYYFVFCARRKPHLFLLNHSSIYYRWFARRIAAGLVTFFSTPLPKEEDRFEDAPSLYLHHKDAAVSFRQLLDRDSYSPRTRRGFFRLLRAGQGTIYPIDWLRNDYDLYCRGVSYFINLEALWRGWYEPEIAHRKTRDSVYPDRFLRNWDEFEKALRDEGFLALIDAHLRFLDNHHIQSRSLLGEFWTIGKTMERCNAMATALGIVVDWNIHSKRIRHIQNYESLEISSAS
ncbi:MAG: hypothetical protein HYS44_03280 [Candidatus Niyogibacteria bacterium]|nr:hypothetical protein [Candidatus Niyogibacteria bacterium]